MDARDETTWLIVELTPQGERAAEDGSLESLLRDGARVSSTHPVFVPCLSYEHNGRRSVLSVMEGYAFIGSDMDGDCITGLVNTPYVHGVLSRGRGIRKVFDTLPDSSVRDLRTKLNEMVGFDLEEGMVVRVNDGGFLGVTGTILVLYDDKASVLVSMRSINVVKSFLRFLLSPVGGGDE